MKSVTSPASLGAKSLLIGLALLLLGGCATFSRDGGFNSVESVAKERLNKDVRWLRSDAEADNAHAAMKKLLASPLSADDAVQIALLNNRGLQATYAELGIAEADLVQAGRLSNPRFAYLNVHSSDESKIERALTFNFMQLITMPLATRLERRRFEQTQLRVAAEVLQVEIGKARIAQAARLNEIGLGDAKFGVSCLQAPVVEQGYLHGIIDRHRVCK